MQLSASITTKRVSSLYEKDEFIFLKMKSQMKKETG